MTTRKPTMEYDQRLTAILIAECSARARRMGFVDALTSDIPRAALPIGFEQAAYLEGFHEGKYLLANIERDTNP